MVKQAMIGEQHQVCTGISKINNRNKQRSGQAAENHSRYKQSKVKHRRNKHWEKRSEMLDGAKQDITMFESPNTVYIGEW